MRWCTKKRGKSSASSPLCLTARLCSDQTQEAPWNSVFLWLQAGTHHVHHSMQPPLPGGKKGGFLSFFPSFSSIKLLINTLLQPAAWWFALLLAVVVAAALSEGECDRAGQTALTEWPLSAVTCDTDRRTSVSQGVRTRSESRNGRTVC